MLQLVVDAVMITAGWGVVLTLSNITIEARRSTERSLVMTAIVALITLVVLDRRDLYAGRPALPRTEEISRVFLAVVTGASALALTAAVLDWHIGAKELLFGAIVVFTLRTLTRGLLRTLATEIRGGADAEQVVIVGTGDEAKGVVDLILDHPEARFQLAGVVGNLAVAERSGLSDQWIGPAGRLAELMHQHEATTAIVTATGFRGDQFREITQELFQAGYDVHLTTGVTRLGEGRFGVRSLSHEPLVVMERNTVHRSHLAAKRVLDVIGASIALVLAAPIMAVAALAIMIEDGRPVFYSANRAGRRGEPFPMFKFRSMVTNADALKASIAADNERTGPLFKVSNDPRITRVGRILRETSIDELPQLMNVLRGDMSLVGPRPALPEEVLEFDDELRDRAIVRPGITGLWQVEARSNSAFNAYRRLDLHYVENWSIGLDLRILLATVEQVVVTLALLPLRFVRRGGSVDGVVTAPGPIDARGTRRPPLAEPTSRIGTTTGPVLAGATSSARPSSPEVEPAAAGSRPGWSGKMEPARGEEPNVVIDLRDRSRARRAAETGQSTAGDATGTGDLRQRDASGRTH
ncbi:MAG: exopolysaccharide biosynthesis polyprenyl glycosylphosphotransferase [Acidimicrobiales bacterium]